MILTKDQITTIARDATELLAKRWPEVPQSMWQRLLVTLAIVESRGDTNAKNKASSARGLMQMLTGTRAWVEGRLGRKPTSQDSLYDPAYAMLLAAEYVAYLWKYKAKRSWDGTVIAYNQGHVNKSQAGKSYWSKAMNVWNSIYETRRNLPV